MSNPADDPTPGHADHGTLSRSELQRLTIFKWEYGLGSLGFAPQEVDHLVFLTWLRATQRVFG